MAALQEAYHLIKHGTQEAVIVGGLDYNVNPNVIGGMEAFGALCVSEEFMDDPEECMRPFDSDRCGTVIADGGSAMVLVSEDLHSKIGGTVYAELAGCCQVNDAHHLLRPIDNGQGLYDAMSAALIEAGIDLSKGGDENCVDLFSCHATSTPKGDAAEADAIRRLLATSTKLEEQSKVAS